MRAGADTGSFAVKHTAASFRRLPRFPAGVLSVREVAAFMTFPGHFSLFDLLDSIDSLPDEKVFHAPIVTSAALGGEVTLTLRKNGRYRFSGFMRATGLLSFDYRITAIVRSANNDVLVAARHSGTVFGSDTPGERQVNWDETDIDPLRAATIRNTWPIIHRGTLDVRRSSEMAGVVGKVFDLVEDAAKFFVAAQTLGGSLAICLIIGSELGDAGVELPGLGGVVGIGIVGGSVLIWGPLAIGPAIVAGVGVGAVVDALVTIRRMTELEIAFARTVFADSIDFENVRLTNLLGEGNRPFVVPTIDNHILVNIGNVIADPVNMSTDSYPVAGQLLIHELVHVWQIQHRSLSDGYVPGWLCQAAIDGTYEPGAPGPDWGGFGIEQQGTIVDRWFAGSPDGKQINMKDTTPRIPMDPRNPYNRYIVDNVQLGHA